MRQRARIPTLRGLVAISARPASTSDGANCVFPARREAASKQNPAQVTCRCDSRPGSSSFLDTWSPPRPRPQVAAGPARPRQQDNAIASVRLRPETCGYAAQHPPRQLNKDDAFLSRHDPRRRRFVTRTAVVDAGSNSMTSFNITILTSLGKHQLVWSKSQAFELERSLARKCRSSMIDSELVGRQKFGRKCLRPKTPVSHNCEAMEWSLSQFLRWWRRSSSQDDLRFTSTFGANCGSG